MKHIPAPRYTLWVPALLALALSLVFLLALGLYGALAI